MATVSGTRCACGQHLKAAAVGPCLQLLGGGTTKGRRIMRLRTIAAAVCVALLGVLLPGCGEGDGTKSGSTGKPTFTLAWSEYPSWSVFGVASEKGLIGGKDGRLGKIEEKWGVRIDLKLLDYEKCMDAYTANGCSAVCITNMDVLNPSLQRKSVAVIPTSTSDGADACLVEPGINDVRDLKKTKTYGLTESVSQYVFLRCLQLAGEKYADYQFSNLDPGEAAKNMQARSKGTEATMVWNPFLLQTLKLRPDVKVLFDSSRIREEVIDLVVIGEDVLSQPGGKDFACAIIDCYYEFNKMLQDPAQRDELLVALGRKFSSLNLEEMKKATTQTRFYKTPEEGLALFDDDKFHQRMGSIVDLYGQLRIIKGKPPTFGFGSADKASEVNLRFDPTFIQLVKDKK
jgi:hypothetical protein